LSSCKSQLLIFCHSGSIVAKDHWWCNTSSIESISYYVKPTAVPH
jgi:hypothetical protein